MAVLNLAAITAAAAAQVPLIIKDGIEKELGGRPDFIASGTPESLPGQLGQAAARSACRQYGAGLSGLTGQAAVNAETACGPYLDGLGRATPPGIKQSFTGGQCLNVFYSLTYSFNFINPDGSTQEPAVTETRRGVGPILGLEGVGSPQFQSIAYRRPDGLNDIRTGSCANGCYRNIELLSVAREDGQPDDCGDPPPEVTQPSPLPDPTPPPFRFNPIPGIDLPINVDFNPDGTIAVDFGTGPITVDAFNGEGGGGGGGEGGGGVAPPGDVGSPGGSQATGDAGEAEGEAPEGQVLTGLRVVLTVFPPTRTLLENGVYRGAYYAYMGVPGLLDLDTAGAAATLDQFILAEKDNLTAWRLRTNRGYNATVTPYYRTPE